MPLLIALVHFEGPDLDHVSFEGSTIPSASLNRILARARSAESWTLEAVETALNVEGAMYGPAARSAVVDLVALDRWSAALGRLTLTDIEFVWRPPVDGLPSKDRVTSPRWVIGLKGTDSRGADRCYRILLEPINGRPTGLLAHSCIEP